MTSLCAASQALTAATPVRAFSSCCSGVMVVTSSVPQALAATMPISVTPMPKCAIVVDHGTWELGTVPLNTAVRPEWLLRNTGDEAVVIGEPRPEVRQGCCPGPIALSSRTIPPGGEATLAFELSMHPGMDGWHDIAIHVPVSAGSDDQVLTLDVTGDFRDT